MADEKQCPTCRKTKQRAEFYSVPYGQGMSTRCKQCHCKRGKAYRAANPGRYAAASRRKVLKKHGLTQERFDAILAAQGGACACGSTTPGGQGTWHIDHDHECCPGQWGCGKCVRGLLCASCNLTLGRFGDDPEKLMALVRYLEDWQIKR